MVDLPDVKAFHDRRRATVVRGGAPRRPERMIETKAFGSNPGALRMLSYAPAGLGTRAPLVVVLHGCTQAGEPYAINGGWLQLADRYGFAVLAPEQRSANNPNLCFNWFQPQDVTRGSGEAASIREMIEAAVAAHGLDRSRIFVTGLSAGGAMTSAMLAAYPEVFAGGGVIAGLAYGAADGVQEAFGAMFQGRDRTPAEWGDLVRLASSHDGPWPRVSVWQGDADSTVKAVNAEAIARQWTNVHGLPSAPARISRQGGRRTETWLSADGRPAVETHMIAGLAHGAPLATGGPDGVGSAAPFMLEAGVSSSLELLRFWGLAEAAKPAAAGADEPPVTRVRETPVGRTGIQGVIERALAAAGLMR